MRVRIEPFGSWVRLQNPPALVALNREATGRLGIDGGARWTTEAEALPSAPLEVHMAVTSRCGAGCKGCYLDATPDGAMPPLDELYARLDTLAQAGVFTVAFGGGEPLGRNDLAALANYARAQGLSPVMTTSGIGMTPARAQGLRAFDQVNVSYDGERKGYTAVRGFDGARVAERAMDLLAQANVPFGVNVVLTRLNFDQVQSTVLRAVELGAREAQLIRFKPAGRALGVTYLDLRLRDQQVRQVYALLEHLVTQLHLSVRIDCAMVPFLVEHVTDVSSLLRFGVFGCEAGRHLAAVDVNGRLAPCSFSQASSLPITALTQAQELREDPAFMGYREHSAVAPEPCASCALREVCRGGCRVVALHAGDPSGPDPECPRVIEHRKAHRGETPPTA